MKISYDDLAKLPPMKRVRYLVADLAFPLGWLLIIVGVASSLVAGATWLGIAFPVGAALLLISEICE